VLLLGNLGSHHTNIPVETFRGFAISDELAPFVVINDQDAHAAWSFTALHELAHLWLGTTGVSGGSAENRIERYCNEAAAEVLLPLAEMRQLAHLRNARFAALIDTLSAFANTRKISRRMVAYTLWRANIIADATWRQVQEHFRQEWIASRNRQPEPDEREAGGKLLRC
jgi:Zn-dependent peptidase ImmA (M78 family)